jgi:acyl carrier protein
MDEILDKVSAVLGLLTEIGVDSTGLRRDSRLRADLGLDSVETTQLEIELRERFDAVVDLWDAHDYAVCELAELLPDR